MDWGIAGGCLGWVIGQFGVIGRLGSGLEGQSWWMGSSVRLWGFARGGGALVTDNFELVTFLEPRLLNAVLMLGLVVLVLCTKLSLASHSRTQKGGWRAVVC